MLSAVILCSRYLNDFQTFFQGKNLNFVLTKHDFRVMIGDVNCSVTSISSSQLTCLPSEQNSILPDASVKVGCSYRACLTSFPQRTMLFMCKLLVFDDDDDCDVIDTVMAH